MKVTRSVDFQVQIGQRIRFFRNKKKWTQKQLGKECNIAGTTISKYERGEKNIGVQCLQDTIIALGVDAIKFFRSGLFARVTR